jgi:hypothetical protein
MTAQIAIMNKNAVAVATDSAVTTRDARGTKVYNSANKLFTLSKYQPVGVMIHANAEFMDYPWETLIKVYRKTLGRDSFPTVAEYADAFFKFLLSREELFGLDRQDIWFRNRALRFLSDVNDEFTNVIRKYFEEHGEMDDAIVSRLFEAFLGDAEKTNQGKQYLPLYQDDATLTKFVAAADPIVRETLAKVFQSLPIEAFRERIVQFTLTRFLTDTTQDYSGVVFAGFGDNEMLPVVDSYWTDGIFGGIVRYGRQESLSGNLNERPTSWIFPFAQSDTVYRFLQGIDPQYKIELAASVEALAKEIADHVAGATSQLYVVDEARSEAESALKQKVDESKQQLWQQLNSLERARFLSPVMDVVGSLPKEDLAAIAESLVNLTSFQRKILREAETVGGPIDVAVISKGDGFIWIKRKHYFEKDLNPAFFANYYRGDDHDD